MTMMAEATASPFMRSATDAVASGK